MKKLISTLLSLSIASIALAQDGSERETVKGHVNSSKFKQLKTELATPNVFRNAAGAPGPQYYQQQADYRMDIEIDDKNQILYGNETITYTNNSPDILEYLWVQLDQNTRAKDSKSHLLKSGGASNITNPKKFVNGVLSDKFDGGYTIKKVKTNGEDLDYIINHTMMRVNLEEALKPGETFTFDIQWNYNINDYIKHDGRSGYEPFPEENNNIYVIAQFFPRMAVYNDVEGWQNMQFWGSSEFALPFGNYDVSITVPEDHIMNATGSLTNPKEVLTKKEYKRFKKSKTSFDNPVMIVTEKEARLAEKTHAKKKVTWKFHADNVRDFGFSTSRKFIWDAMAVKVGKRTVMAHSLYPKEGNPLWEEYSTRTIAHTLKSYGKYTFDYPYPKAVSVHAAQQGMEYPMICWNYGRPEKDGTYSDRVKYGMISVIVHEVGHNFFPMIVNSDERQWTWMDEGLNTFMQGLAEQSFHESFPNEFKDSKHMSYPSSRIFAKDIVRYMSSDQSHLMPIMTQGDHIFHFGSNAYSKPSVGLSILRHTIMGEELFDFAFKTYSKRWKFKHPTPADFFRTMEDASGMDLDWFWRGWFLSTDVNDMGVKEVNSLVFSNKPSKAQEASLDKYGLSKKKRKELIYARKSSAVSKSNYTKIKAYKKYLKTLSAEDRKAIKNPKYFYDVTFEKPGGLIMPLIVQFTFADGSKELIHYPAEVWKKNENGDLKKFYSFEKELSEIVVDPYLETADIDLNNNTWPKKNVPSKFDEFKLRRQISKQK